MSDIDNIIKNSSKAELLEKLTEYLNEYDKAVVVLIKDKERGGFSSETLLLGVENLYDACGILKVAEHDLLHDNI
jgi:hypothetical protein